MTRWRSRKVFPVAHVRFRVTDDPTNGQTFALMIGDEDLPERQRVLFSGHIEKGMAAQLRELAKEVHRLESKLEKLDL